MTASVPLHKIYKIENGDPTAVRTRDTLIKSQVLYRLSYWTMLAGDTGFEPVNDGVKVRCLTAWRIPNNGAADGNRTHV